jgi:predicted O-linked N-acetylglucosamine transferase (SPINDLY family)
MGVELYAAPLRMAAVLGWLWKRDRAYGREADVTAAEQLVAEGNRLEDAGDLAGACERYRQALAIAPRFSRAHVDLGVALEASGDEEGARGCYETALRLDEGNAAAAYNLGKLLFLRRSYAEADRLLRRALASRADFPEARIVRGYVLQALGDLPAAADDLRLGVQKRPADAAARGVLSQVASDLLAQDPQNPAALHALGLLAYQSGDLARANELLARSSELRPDDAQAHFDLARARHARGEAGAALASYRLALARNPEHAEALFQLAGIHAGQGRLAEAIDCYRNLLRQQPAHAAALCNLATALKELGQLPEAIERYREAIASAPAFAEAHYNLGVALRDDGRNEPAIESFRRALELRPAYADAAFGLGHALRDTGAGAEAIACFDRALAIDPEHAQARWSRSMAQLPAVPERGEEVAASRAHFAAELEDLDRWFDAQRLRHAAVAVGTDQPFELAYQEENNRPLLERYGRLCARLMEHWGADQRLPRPAATRQRPLRVAIVSAHLRNHSVWSAITRGWFETLDPRSIALSAFHLGVHEDAETDIAKTRAVHYERGPQDLEKWAASLARHAPDVIIYPEVGIDPMTVRLASLRLASVQVATWGHPETTGLPTIDYYVSSEALEPDGADAYYTERLVRLPNLGCRFRRVATAATPPELSLLRLDADTPLLVCPGVPFKYAPRHDWVFPEIARRLGKCRFVFFRTRAELLSQRLERRLQAVFAARGLAYERFVAFMPWQPASGFLGVLQRADVYLDTIGFSGFNTALYAVEAGLPIVCREGRFLRGRLASAIVRRLGLPELVTPTEEAYVELAVRLASDRAYRQSVRERMEKARPGLYEDPAPIRALEEFLLQARPPA